MGLFGFLALCGYGQGGISGGSFEAHRLPRSPLSTNGEGQAGSITFDHDDWPNEKTNSLPLLEEWLKTTHMRITQ